MTGTAEGFCPPHGHRWGRTGELCALCGVTRDVVEAHSREMREIVEDELRAAERGAAGRRRRG